MSVFILGGSAVVPSLLLLWYIYARDKNPEPRGLLIKTFLLGAFICAPVVPVAMALESMGQGLTGDVWGSALVKAFLGAAIPEEFFKFLVLRWYVWRKTHFDEPLDGVVYGATASLGFATLENILYVGSGGLEVAVLRAVTAVPCHAFAGVVMGAFLGRARFAEDPGQRSALAWMGFGAAVLLHGAYDAFLFAGSGFALLALVVLFIEVRWGRKLYKQLQVEQVVAAQAVTAGPLLAMSVPMEQPALVAPLGALMGGGEGSGADTATEYRVRTVHHEPPGRTLWAWTKLGFGGLGLSFCGLWWLAVAAVLFFPDAADEPLTTGAKVGLIIFSALPTLICLALFRSGLRGPFVPAEGR
jgi:RsiW-degrading membrane proteinase PrsW (M82 family)